MAHVIEMCGGFVRETVFGLDDAMDLVGEYMGAEFRNLMGELIEELELGYIETYQDETDMDDLYCRISEINGMIDRVREASEELADLIREESLDRSRISETAGRIGTETWKLLSKKLPEKKEDPKE